MPSMRAWGVRRISHWNIFVITAYRFVRHISHCTNWYAKKMVSMRAWSSRSPSDAMASIVMAYIVMAYMVMIYIVMAYMVMVYIVMA